MEISANNSSIDRELRSGERVIWKGKPAAGIKLRGSDAFLIPFSLLWGGFAIFWEVMAVTQTLKDRAENFVFPLFGVPFVLIGLYVIFGRFIFDAKSREKTEYAITNQRVIIKSGLFSKKIKIINVSSMPEISFTEKSDGTGTITFGESSSSFYGFMRGFNWPGMPYAQAPAFEMISDVRTVYELIQKVQRNEFR